MYSSISWDDAERVINEKYNLTNNNIEKRNKTLIEKISIIFIYKKSNFVYILEKNYHNNNNNNNNNNRKKK